MEKTKMMKRYEQEKEGIMKELLELIKLETGRLYVPPENFGYKHEGSANDMINRIHVLRKDLLELEKEIIAMKIPWLKG